MVIDSLGNQEGMWKSKNEDLIDQLKDYWGKPWELVLNILTKFSYQSGIKYFCNFLLQAED